MFSVNDCDAVLFSALLTLTDHTGAILKNLCIHLLAQKLSCHPSMPTFLVSQGGRTLGHASANLSSEAFTSLLKENECALT